MFYVIFGLIWTTICSIIIYGFYNPNSSDEILVNGETFTSEEFSQLLWPKLLLGLCLLIGIIIFIIGLRLILRDVITGKRGTKAYGFLISMEPNGQTINDIEALDAIFLVLEENGECNIYRKNVGLNNAGYIPEEFYEVLYHKKNIKILSRVDENMVPMEDVAILKNALYSDKNPNYIA